MNSTLPLRPRTSIALASVFGLMAGGLMLSYSPSYADGAARATFDYLDQNDDEWLSPAELSKETEDFLPKPGLDDVCLDEVRAWDGIEFKRLDENGNDQVTFDEFNVDYEYTTRMIFKALDQSGDQLLNKAEFAATEELIVIDDPQSAAGLDPEPTISEACADQLFAASNLEEGELSEDLASEVALVEADFHAADRDQDGHLSLDEFKDMDGCE